MYKVINKKGKIVGYSDVDTQVEFTLKQRIEKENERKDFVVGWAVFGIVGVITIVMALMGV